MRGEKFNPDMLRLARNANALTQGELAKAAGVTQALISKLEAGLIAEPGTDVIAALSKHLRFPPEFFYQEERAVGFPHFHYRKRAKLGVKPLDRIGAIINIRRQHVSRLLQSYDIEIAKPIPQIDLDETGLTPERVAERLRGYWMVPRGPVANVVDLIEQAGGIVILARFGTNLLDGISFRLEGLPPLFFMNKDVPGDRFRFSLAHELGHMVLHSIPGNEDELEDEAHRFAAALLMPAAEIKPFLIRPTLSGLARVKAHWKVSIKSLIKRAFDLKLITPWQYKSLNIQYRKAFNDTEPLPIEMEQPWRLREIVQYHRDKLGYSLEDLAKLLRANAEDVERAYLGGGRPPGLRLVVSNP